MAQRRLMVPTLLLSIILILALVTVVACVLMPVLAETSFNATFDFDTSLPPLAVGQNTPFNQTSEVVMARFSSPADPNAFSIQVYGVTWFKLSDFSGNFLHDNIPIKNALEIQFNQSLTGISLTYATLEYKGDPNDEPTSIILTAYMNSTSTSPVGSATSRGLWPNGSTYPQGKLSYNSSQPFNLVRIELSSQEFAVDFLVDDVNVTNTTYVNYPIPGSFPNTSIIIITLLTVIIIVFAIFVIKKDFFKKS